MHHVRATLVIQTDRQGEAHAWQRINENNRIFHNDRHEVFETSRNEAANVALVDIWLGDFLLYRHGVGVYLGYGVELYLRYGVQLIGTKRVIMADEFDPASVTWVFDKESLEHLAGAIETCKEVVFDLETTGLNEHETGCRPEWPVPARIVMISLTLPQTEVENLPTTWVVPLSHPDSPLIGHWRIIMKFIAQRIKKCGKPIINQNIKFDCRWIFAHTGIDLSHLIAWDTMQGSHLLDETSSTKLKERAPVIFSIERWDDFDLSTPGAAEHVPLFDLGLYAARDTYWSWRLAEYQRKMMYLHPDTRRMEPESADEIEAARLGKLATWCAMPTVATLTAMEQRGMRLDINWVKDKLREDEGIARVLQGELAGKYTLHDTAGKGIDFSTPSFAPTSHWFKAWAESAVSAGDLRVAAMTPNGNPQWSKAVLVRQAREGSQVADDLLDMRKAVKRAEYLRSWLDYTSSSGFIHSTYHTARVVTGRLSSSGSNMQQITKSLKPAFIPSIPEYVLLELDYGQIELRIAAFISRCETMIEAFRQGKDLHTMLAAEITGKPLEEVSSTERQAGKCFHPDTEVLTRSGWKCIVDLAEGEEVMQGHLQEDGSVTLDWVVPWQVYTMPNEHGHLTHLKNEGMDLRVTPDHGMLAYTAAGTWERRMPEKMNAARYWLNAGTAIGRQVVDEDLLRVAVMVQADGSYEGNLVRLGFTKTRKIVRCRALLTASRINYNESIKKNGSNPDVTSFSFEKRHVSGLLNDDKTLPWWWIELIEHLREVVLDECPLWDGTHSMNWQMSQYMSTPQINRDVMQALAAVTGRKTRDDGYGKLTIRAKWSDRSRGGNLSITEEPYTGTVACLAVESGIVMVRDRGVVAITYQSANFGLLYMMGPFGFREYAETTYGISFTLEEATHIHHAFYEMWSGIGAWHNRVIARAQATGQVISPIGRVRRVPSINDGNEKFAERAKRAAVNSPVQGFASDLMQLAAASIEGTLPGVQGVSEAFIVGTVHDSIILEVPQERWRQVAEECMDRMINVNTVLKHVGCELDVPLTVEGTCGTRWGMADIGTCSATGT